MPQKSSFETETLPFSAFASRDGLLHLDLLRVALRQPRRSVRHRRLVGRDALLVPVRDRGDQVRPLAEGGLDLAVGLVGPALVLDLDSDRLREGHGVHEVPAVRAHARAQPLPFRDGRAGVFALGHVETPRVVEVVLGAGALDRGDLFAVHVEHVVAFAEPARARPARSTAPCRRRTRGPSCRERPRASRRRAPAAPGGSARGSTPCSAAGSAPSPSPRGSRRRGGVCPRWSA